jgi:hypothetical protein
MPLFVSFERIEAEDLRQFRPPPFGLFMFALGLTAMIIALLAGVFTSITPNQSLEPTAGQHDDSF